MSSGLLVTSPVYPVHVSHALSCLDVSIKYYYLSLCPRLRVPVPPSCVHHDSNKVATVVVLCTCPFTQVILKMK